MPIDSVDEKELQVFQELITSSYVKIIYDVDNSGQRKEISGVNNRKKVDSLINDLLDGVSMLSPTSYSITSLSKIYSTCYRLHDSYEAIKLEATTKQRVLAFYKAIIEDDKSHPLLLLEISRNLSITENKIFAKEILFKCLDNPNIFDDIVHEEQLYNMYNYLAMTFYNLGYIRSAAKYNEAARQLNENYKNSFICSASYEEFLLIYIKISDTFYAEEISIFEQKFEFIVKSLEEYFLIESRRESRYYKLKKIVCFSLNLLVAKNLYSLWDKSYARIMDSFNNSHEHYLEYRGDQLYRYRSEFRYIYTWSWKCKFSASDYKFLVKAVFCRFSVD